MKITEKVKTFEDACNVLGISTDLPDCSALPGDNRHIDAYYQLVTIAKALNDGWEPD